MEVLAEQGATVTHHHAVGRDHRFGYEQQTSPLFRQTLAAGKHFLDPQGILNPGALFDPQDKKRWHSGCVIRFGRCSQS